MSGQVLIDGNNLLHAMRAHAPVPLVGRETMVRHIERWAREGADTVVLYLDGRLPDGPMAKQMSSGRIDVRFSGPRTADDLIADAIRRAADPGRLRLVSGDTALIHEAHRRGARVTNPVEFISELFPPAPRKPGEAARAEKPGTVSPEEAESLAGLLGDLADELSDGFEDL